MKIIKRQTFRSTPYVNITNDMVRITADMTMHGWYIFCDIFNKTKNGSNKKLDVKKGN